MKQSHLQIKIIANPGVTIFINPPKPIEYIHLEFKVTKDAVEFKDTK